ncbi:ECF-type sigma factor [Paludisphaera mucosa]|uniref:ECF-type sigma factor n=1 Tax=Paludisphaera mucosa TaxID=3030827 RepID=A0ABT6F4L8_9BACT|nr:ECF-type sigma factor [Paludisphaera mucosa]MDG3002441.1 ECF-type sigma factor [Paludisphaera mucosa]
MSDDVGSITGALRAWKDGDRDSIQRLWEAYFHRLVGLARGRLDRSARSASDEEDVALSAFASFCRRAERGEFPRLDDREDLWRLLFVITTRKAINRAHRDLGARRGGGRVASATDLDGLDLRDAVERGPTPEAAAQMDEDVRRLLDGLGDETLRSVAVWKLQGYTNAEIARRLACVETTVERKLRAIRALWQDQDHD